MILNIQCLTDGDLATLNILYLPMFLLFRNPTVQVDNFGVGGIHRKRKYEEEQFGYPIQPHKFRVRAQECGFKCQINDNGKVKELERTTITLKLNPTESVKDSNSFMGIYETTVSLNAENADHAHIGFQKPQFGGAASSSGNSSDSVNDNFKLNRYSLDSRSVDSKHSKKRQESRVEATEEDEMRCKSKSFQDPNTGFEMSYAAYTDFMCTEYGIDKEHISDFVTDELLYSNDVATDMLMLAPGGWIPTPGKNNGFCLLKFVHIA